jgi:hypothetical protein
MKHLFAGVLLTTFLFSQDRSLLKAPPRSEGDGPFARLIIRGVTVIDGTGAPPFGPMDVVVEKNRIVAVRGIGTPGTPLDSSRFTKSKEGDKVLNCFGMYLLPGFVDMHGHVGGTDQVTSAEYVFKLWMGHGITTVRDPGSGNGLEWMLDQKKKSDANEITAPRLNVYVGFGSGAKSPIRTPEEARRWVQELKQRGGEGIKFFGARPDIFVAALDEAKKQGLRTACHHAQLGVVRMNALQTARAGLTSMEHWYGLPEALFTDKTVQNYPDDYNYNDEYDRFSNAGKLWKQAAAPYSERWNDVMNELLKLDFTIDPTFTIYEANRDLMAQRTAEWHQEYTLPSLWKFYEPSKESHGSYWFDWTTQDEIEWKNNYRLWMTFVNEFKNRGGRVTTGSDAGYIYKLYGFGLIREMELLQEAGFHPLEVIRSATLKGAEALGLSDQIGSVEVGKLADFVIIDQNPLHNFKYLYATGAIKVDDNNKAYRVGGVNYTVKDGIVYDAKKLLADVRRLVAEDKKKAGIETLKQPGAK